MTVKVKAGAHALSEHERYRYGRATNATAELLRQKLSVPNIYLNPQSDLLGADVLAVDRAGAGDLHGVWIKLYEFVPDANARRKVEADRRTRLHLRTVIHDLKAKPAHYRYLAVPKATASLLEWDTDLFAGDGIGRIGIMGISGAVGAPPQAELLVIPERFRVEAAKLASLERNLLNKVRPDIEVRI